MRELKTADAPLQPPRLFGRRQILALNIFNQRDLDRVLIGQRRHDHRDVGQARKLRRAPASDLSSDSNGSLTPCLCLACHHGCGATATTFAVSAF
jgi:hypothetical protein